MFGGFYYLKTFIYLLKLNKNSIYMKCNYFMTFCFILWAVGGILCT